VGDVSQRLFGVLHRTRIRRLRPPLRVNVRSPASKPALRPHPSRHSHSVHPAAWAEVLVIRPEESASPALQRFRVPACTPGPVSAHEAGPVKCACAARTDEPYALSDEPVGGVVALSFHAVRPHRRQRTTTSPCPGPLPPCRGMGSLKSRSSTSCHTFQQSSSLRWRPCPYRLPESGYTMGTGRQPRPRRWWGQDTWCASGWGDPVENSK